LDGYSGNRALAAALAGVVLICIASHLIPGTVAQRSTAINAPVDAASIIIDAGKIEGRLSPLLYGQFAEFMYENIKGGLHAEMLRNRSFEEAPNAIGLSRYWERYPDDRNDDYGLSFHWDGETAYPKAKKSADVMSGHSLRVQLSPGVIARHGIYQSRLPVSRGVEYRGYFWMKTEGFDGNVAATLERDLTGGEVYAGAEIKNVSGDWKKYEFNLKPVKSDPLARLAILFDGRGRVWVDQVSLMPGDAVDDVRADEAVKPIEIRWPSGNLQRLSDVKGKQLLEITEPQAKNKSGQ
jgi:alpha-N-arabinofuranosidase